MNEILKELRETLKQLRIQRTKLTSETGCVPCDLAVASSLIAYCYRDKKRGEEMRNRFLNGEITLAELMQPIQNTDLNSRNIKEFVQKKFKHAMNLKFTDFEPL